MTEAGERMRKRKKRMQSRKATTTATKYGPLSCMQNNMKPHRTPVAYGSQATGHHFLREREIQVSSPPSMPKRTFAAETKSCFRPTALLAVGPHLLVHKAGVLLA